MDIKQIRNNELLNKLILNGHVSPRLVTPREKAELEKLLFPEHYVIYDPELTIVKDTDWADGAWQLGSWDEERKQYIEQAKTRGKYEMYRG